jgi:hypothetical protein
MNAQVTGFRVALGFILIGAVVLSAMAGGISGALTGAVYGNSIAVHAVFGTLIGAVIGWVLGSYAHGIGYTLLSINDQLADISSTLKSGAPFATSIASTPASSVGSLGSGAKG